MLIFFLSAEGNDRIRLNGEKNRIFRVHTKNSFSVFTRSQTKNKGRPDWNEQKQQEKRRTTKRRISCFVKPTASICCCCCSLLSIVSKNFSFSLGFCFCELYAFKYEENATFIFVICETNVNRGWDAHSLWSFLFSSVLLANETFGVFIPVLGFVLRPTAKNTETKAKKYEKKIIAFVRYVCRAEAWIFLPFFLQFLTESNVSKKKVIMQLNIEIRVRAFRVSAHTKITKYTIPETLWGNIEALWIDRIRVAE